MARTKSIVKNLAGRPAIITDEVVSKLEQVLRLDVTDKMACEFAGISRETFYRWMKDNERFRDRIVSARNYARIAAGQVVMKAIIQDNDVASAKWWLEKKYANEFQTKPELLQDNRTQINYFQNYEQLAEQLFRLSRQVVKIPNPPEGEGTDK